ncbi:MAG: hypothetical protein JSS69_14905 [Acidobacteria bacterium]|nr:hypothetical protein [Acidobacteriota bacterium]MBS1867201.1 hypothetical protein [Acidobacteriota bacterium]
MKLQGKIRRKGGQSGIALLLAIFVLLLVCVVGIAMLAASGTETSLSGNYRSATGVYYAAFSGLEEGRSRLLPQSPNSLSPAYIPPYGTMLPLGTAIYITNPSPGPPAETVDPTALGNPNEYPDTEWAKEFPGYNPPSPIQIVASVQNLSSMAGAQNALYKWVRINALSEYAIQIDVNNSNPGAYTYRPDRLIYFDGTNLTRNIAQYQALGITALAALPDGSRKLLQYVVGPSGANMQIYSAVTMTSAGTALNPANFDPPPSGAFTFKVNGTDQMGTGKLPTCVAQPALPAFGVFYPTDVTSVQSGVNKYPADFTGTPVISNLSSSAPASATWDDPVQLANLVDSIQGGADYVLTGPVTESNLPASVSVSNASYPSNPMTVVVNGDLSLSGYTGYGLLVVTGTLTFTGDSGWRGLVLVIGNGTVVETGSGSGGEFDGAMVVANITGGTMGATQLTVANPGGNGIYYDSCWIAAVQKPNKYRVLSFREIPYP